MTVKMAKTGWYAPKWSKNSPKGPKKTTKRGQNDAETTPNDAETMPKWSLSDPKVTPESTKIDLKSPHNHPKHDPSLVPKWPYIARDRVKNGQRGSKRGQKGPKTVQKSQMTSSKCIKTLKIYSFTAHFHRLKRRFWDFVFLSKTSVL